MSSFPLTPTPQTFNQFEGATKRELNQLYGQRIKDLSFVGKLGVAAKYETFTGQLLQEMNDPNFTPDPNCMVTQELIDEYAGDITNPEILERILSNSSSFGEFIFNTDNVRRSLKKREELFAGGPMGMLGGFIATLIPTTAEMLPATIAATAAAGPLGGGAAFVDRTTRMNRVLGAVKGLGIAGLVDLPLEYGKYSMDQSLTQKQFLLAMATAGGMGATVGAAFPSTLFKVSNAIKNELRLEEAIKIGNNFGDATAKASARRLSKSRRLSTKAEGVIPGTTKLEGRGVVRKYLKSDVINNLRDSFGAVLPTAAKVGSKNLGAVGTQLNDLVQAAFMQLPTTGTLNANKASVRDAIKSLRAAIKDKDFAERFTTLAERGDQTSLTNRFFSMANEAEKLAATGVQLEVAKILRKFAAGAINPAGQGAKALNVADLDKSLAALQKRIQRNDMFEVTASREAKRGEMLAEDAAMGRVSDEIDPATGLPMSVATSADSGLVEVEASDLVKAASTQNYRMRVAEGFREGGFREGLARAVDVFGVPSLMTASYVRMMRSDSKNIRNFATIFFSGPRQNGSALPVEVIARTNVERVLTKVSRQLNTAKINAAKKGVQISDVDITRAITSGANPGGELGQAVKAVREFYRDLHGYAIRGEVFEDIPFDLKYVQRKYNDVHVVRMIDEFGEESMLGFIGSAIKRAPRTTPLSDDQARKVAQRILDYNKDPNLYGRWRKNSQEAFNAFEKKLRRDLDGLTDDQINDILEMVAPNQSQNPHLGMTYRRIAMDENYSASLTGKNGTRVVHIDELMDRDLSSSLGLYAQRVIGAVELRRGFKAMRPDSDEVMSLSDLDILLREGGDKQASVATTSLDNLYRFTMGYGYDMGESMQKIMKMVQDAHGLAMANFGGMMGVAQMPEVASVIARNSARSAMVPLTRGTWWRQLTQTFMMGPEKLTNKAVYGTNVLGESRRPTGELADDLMAQLETWTGVGGDMVRGDYITRRLDMMEGETTMIGGVRGITSRTIDVGRQAAILNPFGILPVDTVMRRWCTEAAFQSFVNRAYKIKGAGGITADMGFFGGGAKKMFKETGMSDEMIDRVIKELTRPEGVAKVEQGAFGNYKVKKIDFSKVKDKHALDNLAIAMRRHVDRTVQRNYLGDMPTALNNPAVRAFMQFRVFMLVSKSKQLAYGIAGFDGRIAGNVIGGAFLGILGYKILHYQKSLSMSETERIAYLDEKFSNKNLINAGITRNTFATSMPMLYDTMANIIGEEPQFSQRTTVGASGLFQGSTLMQMISQGERSLKEIMSGLAGNDPISQEDLIDLARFGGMMSVPFVSQAIQMGFEQIPIPEED